MGYFGWRPYKSVAKRRTEATREMGKLQKKGKKIEPVSIEGRKIAKTFWGDAWCGHLEKFSDFENRLPRGRTYVRNGSVCHLAISNGKIESIVSGSSIYKIKITITPLPANKWSALRKACAGQIGSMLELLQGKMSHHVMETVIDRKNGLFPQPNDMTFSCSCPDWASMCKHVAATLYGVGARLDAQPELLFLLRNVDHAELVTAGMDLHAITRGKGKRRHLSDLNLSDVFGVDIDDAVKPVRKTSDKVKSVYTVADAVSKPADSAKKSTPKIAKKSRKNTPFTFTPNAIKKLRKRFQMSRTEFAKLLDVSVATAAKWENTVSELRLLQRSRDTLTHAATLTPTQAMEKIAAHALTYRKY